MHLILVSINVYELIWLVNLGCGLFSVFNHILYIDLTCIPRNLVIQIPVYMINTRITASHLHMPLCYLSFTTQTAAILQPPTPETSQLTSSVCRCIAHLNSNYIGSFVTERQISFFLIAPQVRRSSRYFCLSKAALGCRGVWASSEQLSETGLRRTHAKWASFFFFSSTGSRKRVSRNQRAYSAVRN